MDKDIKRIFGEDVDVSGVKSPYELYRRMRPYYFSDSKEVLKMTKEHFATIMSNLAANMKQDEFEELTRRLVIKLITPNIIPGTGPNGHGDGKTDLETHPVSDEISKYYIVKDGGCSGDEKWAFAISCTASWEQKMAKDVKKIVETKRGYTHIFFCTNQLVPSRKKADAFEKYKKEYGIETTILDYNWYEQAVFESGCYNAAIESLNIDKTLESTLEEGPNDKVRKQQLQEIDDKHASYGNVEKLNTEYVQELLEAAILQRELSRGDTNSKMQVKMRFALALSESEKHGLSQQIFDVHYETGWTEFYWNEDPEAMMREYATLKELLQKEVNPVRLEKATNLQNLVKTAIHCNLFRTVPDMTEDEKFWADLYTKIENDPEHQSSFLFLKIITIESKLLDTVKSQGDINALLIDLKEAMVEANHHIDISFESHYTIISSIGEFISNNPLYEEVVDQLANIQIERKHEVDAADIHYSRGMQNLYKKNYESAIKHLGQCIAAYQKEQTRTNLIQASGMLAVAYSNLDLLFSAKVFFVKAISLLIHQMNVDGIASHLLVSVMYELCCLDIRLGQLNDFLFWLKQMDEIVMAFPQYNDETYAKNRMWLDSMLASVLMITRPDTPNLEYLPKILGRVGLTVSTDTLLYRLGYEDKVSEDFRNIVMTTEKWDEKLTERASEIPSLHSLSVADKKQTILKTKIKGCQISFSFHSTEWNLCYAEMCLAFIESFLATAGVKDYTFATSHVSVSLNSKTSGKTEVKKGSRTNEYILKVNTKQSTSQQQWELCALLLGHILSRNAMTNDFIEVYNKKEEEEKIGLRISLVGGHNIEFKNSVLQEYPSYIEKWIVQGDEIYPNKNKTASEQNSQYTGKQNETIITDLIDYPLWDKAKWSGCGYIIDRMFEQPPIMVFMYKNIQYGKKIFEQWEEDFLAKKLNIKIIVITGVDAAHPEWYKVMVTPDMAKVLGDNDKKNNRYVVAASRFHLMQAKDNLNVRYLKQAYLYKRFIGITAVALEANNQMSDDPSKRYPKVIPVKEVEFREAWSIGENEEASVAILATDKPVIPSEHVTDAPVIQLLKRKNYGTEQ